MVPKIFLAWYSFVMPSRFYKFKNSKILPRHEILILILKLGLLKPRSTASMTTWQSLMTFRYSSLLFKRLFRINFDFFGSLVTLESSLNWTLFEHQFCFLEFFLPELKMENWMDLVRSKSNELEIETFFECHNDN